MRRLSLGTSTRSLLFSSQTRPRTPAPRLGAQHVTAPSPPPRTGGRSARCHSGAGADHAPASSRDAPQGSDGGAGLGGPHRVHAAGRALSAVSPRLALLRFARSPTLAAAVGARLALAAAPGRPRALACSHAPSRVPSRRVVPHSFPLLARSRPGSRFSYGPASHHAARHRCAHEREGACAAGRRSARSRRARAVLFGGLLPCPLPPLPPPLAQERSRTGSPFRAARLVAPSAAPAPEPAIPGAPAFAPPAPPPRPSSRPRRDLGYSQRVPIRSIARSRVELDEADVMTSALRSRSRLPSPRRSRRRQPVGYRRAPRSANAAAAAAARRPTRSPRRLPRALAALALGVSRLVLALPASSGQGRVILLAGRCISLRVVSSPPAQCFLAAPPRPARSPRPFPLALASCAPCRVLLPASPSLASSPPPAIGDRAACGERDRRV